MTHVRRASYDLYQVSTEYEDDFFPDRELQTCRYAGMAREAAIELHVFVYV